MLPPRPGLEPDRSIQTQVFRQASSKTTSKEPPVFPGLSTKKSPPRQRLLKERAPAPPDHSRTPLAGSRPTTATGNIHEVFHVQIPFWDHNQPIVEKAKEKEMASHDKFGTFIEVDEASLSKEDKEKMLPSTWSIVYKGDPKDGNVKAQLCVRGDKEKGVENIRTNSPTVNAESLRLLLTFAASTGLKINSLDFSSAFVQGKDIERTVFLRPPPDIRAKRPGMVWRVVKRLYGFKDASRGWMLALDSELKRLGMVRSDFDKGLYMWYKDGQLAGLLGIHVDDILHVGPLEMYNTVITALKNKYVIGAEDDQAFTFVGWNLKQTQEGIQLSQQDYLSKTNMEEFQHLRRYALSDKEILSDKEQADYRRLNGILGWLAASLHPSLSFHYSVSSGKIGNATHGDAKFLIRLLDKTKKECAEIRFSNHGPIQDWTIEIFIDASPGKAKVYDSIIGETVLIKSGKSGLRNIFSWRSKKLDIPTATPLEAEAEALLEGYAKLKNVHYLMKEIFDKEFLSEIITDSKSLASSINSDNAAGKSRKIAIAVIMAQKLMEEDAQIKLVWTEGQKNPADLMTKGTSDPRLMFELLAQGRSDLMTSSNR